MFRCEFELPFTIVVTPPIAILLIIVGTSGRGGPQGALVARVPSIEVVASGVGGRPRAAWVDDVDKPAPSYTSTATVEHFISQPIIADG